MRTGVRMSIVLSMVLAVSVAAAGPGPARGRHSKRARGGHGKPAAAGRVLDVIVNHPHVAEELGVSKEKVLALRRQCFEARIAALEAETELKKAHLKKAYLLSEPNPDEKALMEAIEEIGKRRVALEKVKARIQLATQRALTPEQREHLRDMMHRHMQKRMQKHDRSTRGKRPMRHGDGEHGRCKRHMCRENARENEERHGDRE